MGSQVGWVVTWEVVRGSKRRLGGWDWAHANLWNPSTSVLVSRGPYGVVDPSAPWKGGVWVVETSSGSDPHYGVWGGHTVVVHCHLSQWALSFEQAVLQSCDLFSFQNRHIVSR
jgi:hypothetical protein